MWNNLSAVKYFTVSSKMHNSFLVPSRPGRTRKRP